MNNRFAPFLKLKSASIEQHYGLGCVTLYRATSEVLGPQPRQHQGCGVLSESTALHRCQARNGSCHRRAPHVCYPRQGAGS